MSKLTQAMAATLHYMGRTEGHGRPATHPNTMRALIRNRLVVEHADSYDIDRAGWAWLGENRTAEQDNCPACEGDPGDIGCEACRDTGSESQGHIIRADELAARKAEQATTRRREHEAKVAQFVAWRNSPEHVSLVIAEAIEFDRAEALRDLCSRHGYPRSGDGCPKCNAAEGGGRDVEYDRQLWNAGRRHAWCDHDGGGVKAARACDERSAYDGVDYAEMSRPGWVRQQHDRTARAV